MCIALTVFNTTLRGLQAPLGRYMYTVSIHAQQDTCRGKICIEYSDVTNYNCNRRGLLTIKGNPAFRQVNKRGY